MRSASALAPALRRGEPVSLGLRVPEVLDAIRRARATGAAQRAEFFQRVPVERWYEAVVTPISSAETVPGLVLLAFHDLTPLRRVEEMRADFVANASHELRTPLAALSGFIETLQGPARDDPAARERFLAIMQAQANRMARLIDDLLSLSRIELNAHVRPDGQVDLHRHRPPGGRRLQTLARDRDVEVGDHRARRPAARAGRPRRADPRVREPGRERAQIRRLGQARRHRRSRRGPAPPAGRRRASWCATTVPASRPSTCRA